MDGFEQKCSKSVNSVTRLSQPMGVDTKQRIDHYIQRLSDKNFEIYDVRRELEQQKVDEEEIKIIVRAVDAELQARLLRTTNAGLHFIIYPDGNYFDIDRACIRPCHCSRHNQRRSFFHVCLRIFFRRHFHAPHWNV